MASVKQAIENVVHNAQKLYQHGGSVQETASLIKIGVNSLVDRLSDQLERAERAENRVILSTSQPGHISLNISRAIHSSLPAAVPLPSSPQSLEPAPRNEDNVPVPPSPAILKPLRPTTLPPAPPLSTKQSKRINQAFEDFATLLSDALSSLYATLMKGVERIKEWGETLWMQMKSLFQRVFGGSADTPYSQL